MTVTVWISDLNYHRFFSLFFSVLSLVLILVEKIYETLKTMFNHISKPLDVLSFLCMEMWLKRSFVFFKVFAELSTVEGRENKLSQYNNNS